MLDLLDGFSKRMEFFAIADSIANRKNTSDKIESLFQGNSMENLIISILVYIMETTLTEEEECTIENIAIFVKKILPYYNIKNIDIKELTRYIIKDILQNKGQNRYYEVMNYETQTKEKLNVRLISDKLNDENQVIYELTKQGYDFLFRTKEVDDELGFKLEEIKLKMLIHKKNYKKAMETSKDLIKRLKNKKIELNQFESNLRTNINNISGDMYDNLVNNTYKVLDDEYQEMTEIDDLIKESAKRISEEEELTGTLDEKSQKAKFEIWTISKNVKTALNLQRELLIQCKKTKKLYVDTLKESMQYSLVKTYNFKENIIQNLEKANFKDIPEIYVKLLEPLFMPRLTKSLNLNLIYSNQSKIKKEEDEEYSIEQDILEEQTLIQERIERRNKAHIEVMRTLFEYASTHNQFTLSQYLESLKENINLPIMLDEKLIFMQMLKLYATDGIDIEEWKKESLGNQTEANGEFDLSYCLQNLLNEDENLYNIKAIIVTKLDEKIKYTYPTTEKTEIEHFQLKKIEDIHLKNEEEIIQKIEMTNLKFEVKLNGESFENL